MKSNNGKFELKLSEDCDAMLRLAPKTALVLVAYTACEVIAANAGSKDPDIVGAMPKSVQAQLASGEIEAGDILEQLLAAIGNAMFHSLANNMAKEEEAEPEIKNMDEAAELLRKFAANGPAN